MIVVKFLIVLCLLCVLGSVLTLVMLAWLEGAMPGAFATLLASCAGAAILVQFVE